MRTKANSLSKPYYKSKTQTERFSPVPSGDISANRPFLRHLWMNKGAMVGLIIVIMISSIALLAPYIATHNPITQHKGRKLEAPSTEFPLGTDHLSRDLLSRLVYAARPTLGAAALATVTVVIIGTSLGAIAGYTGGFLDEFTMRIVDILMAFPGLILALAIVGVLGTHLTYLILGVTLVSWASYARLVRGLVLEIREEPFIQAAIVIGAKPTHIIWRHIIPNIISPVIVLASLEMGILILTIAGLNFLGLGIQPPTPEWGAMLNQGRPYFQRAPQLMIYPGLMISLTVLGFNLLGDGLRDILDPRSPAE